MAVRAWVWGHWGGGNFWGEANVYSVLLFKAHSSMHAGWPRLPTRLGRETVLPKELLGNNGRKYGYGEWQNGGVVARGCEQDGVGKADVRKCTLLLDPAFCLPVLLSQQPLERLWGPYLGPLPAESSQRGLFTRGSVESHPCWTTLWLHCQHQYVPEDKLPTLCNREQFLTCSKIRLRNVFYWSQFCKALLKKLFISRLPGLADDAFMLPMSQSLRGQGFRQQRHEVHIALPCPHWLTERDRRPGFFARSCLWFVPDLGERTHPLVSSPATWRKWHSPACSKDDSPHYQSQKMR